MKKFLAIILFLFILTMGTDATINVASEDQLPEPTNLSDGPKY